MCISSNYIGCRYFASDYFLYKFIFSPSREVNDHYHVMPQASLLCRIVNENSTRKRAFWC